jgi:hypothetical protein
MPEVYAAHPDYAFERNFKGYGEKGLEGLKWPNNAKIAVSFVINYEEVSPCPPSYSSHEIDANINVSRAASVQ